MKRTILLLLAINLGLLTACGDVEQEPAILEEETATIPSVPVNQNYPSPPESENNSYATPLVQDAYPIPDMNPVEGDEAGYPSPSTSPPPGYPAPETQVDEGKRFIMEEPIVDGQTEISGKGVPEIAIRIISISNTGEALGFGVVSEEGNFTIELSRPVRGGESLGIQFADDNVGKSLEDVPGTDMPLLGLVLAQAVVER